MSTLRKHYLKLLLSACVLISGLFYAGYGAESYNFYGDALGYYMYLPNTFIYHNHTSVETLPKDRGIRPFIHSYAAQMGGGQRGAKGYVINQYTYGIALLEAPFFLAAHAVEKARGSQANGFTESYHNAIDLSTLVYGLLGLWICYRLLRRRFSVNVAATAIALLLIGTNLFWFMFRQQGMAHVPLFFLFALLLELTIRVHKHDRWRDFILLGFVAGLITIIRPVDGVCLLIPVLYTRGGRFLDSLRGLVRRSWLKILVAGACFLLPIIPQLLYWKWLTGYFIYDSYGPGQGFDFRHPAIWSGLLGPSNGWLFYTPVMLAALAGLLLPRRLMGFGLAIPAVLIPYIWCVYAWFLPNYINGFGSRPMIDVYPLLAIPLAAVLDGLLRRRLAVRALATLCILFFVAWNLSASVQQAKGILISQDSRYVYNLKTAFRYRLRYDDLVLWDTGVPQPDRQQLVPAGAPGGIGLRDTALQAQVRDSAGVPLYSVREDQEYPPLRAGMKAAALAAGTPWILAEAKLKVFAATDDIYGQQLLVAQIRRGDSTLRWYGVRINNKIGALDGNLPPGGLTLAQGRENLAGRIAFYFPVPPGLRPDDDIQLDVWNLSHKPMEIMDLQLRGMQLRR